MPLRICLIVASAVFASAAVAHEEEAEEDKGPFEGSIKLGYLATTGNTETSSLNTGFEGIYTKGRWRHTARASAINASEDKVTTAEAYEASWRSDWDLTEKDFLFGRLAWRKDRFGGFDTQFSQTAGYGRKVLDTDRHILDLGIGAGARQSEDQLGVKTDEFIITGGLDYTWQFSETANFKQSLAIEAGEENTFTEAISSVSATLIGRLSLVASWTYRNNSDVPPGTENTDTRTAIALEYTF